MAKVNDPESPFYGFEVISTYSDAQAIEDGVLVAVNKQDRVSRAVWEYLVTHAPKGAQPPNRWPVDMLGWFQAEKVSKPEALKLIAEFGKDEAQKSFDRIIADRKAMALAKGIISTHTNRARLVYEENIGGGIHKLFSMETPDGQKILSLCADQAEAEFEGNYKVLWLMPNENGGVTLMHPEDY